MLGFKKRAEFPMMEHATTRRVQASPMLAGEAMKENVKLAVKAKEDVLGYLVKEPVGKDLAFTYWMPAEMFEGSHLRTDKYTIGEAVFLLMNGAVLTRPYWPKNEMIRWEKEGKTKEGFVRGGFIAKISIYADPIGKEEATIVLDPWIPSQDDLFAKDFQTLNIDFDEVKEGL